MIDDATLLRRYAEEGTDAAFAELVRRNVDLVYATALRVVGDSHRARDIVQLVFIDVARKARALHRHPAFVSWLYTSTRYAALKVLRGEQRRRLRELKAGIMQPPDEPQIDGAHLRPFIDEVLDALGERDREMVLLRYFRGMSFAEIAAVLGMGDGATRMRMERALDRMNRLLVRRGVRSTSAAIALALGADAGIAAPTALAPSATAAALSGAGVGSAAGGLAACFVVSQVKIAAGVLLLAGAAFGVVEVRANRALHARLAVLAPNDRAVLAPQNEAPATPAKIAASDPSVEELTALQARIARLKARPPGVTDASLHPPQNLGRSTPADAAETFCWAVGQRDLDAVASFVRFKDDTPVNRDAFMANFSAAVQARYRTPERLCAAASFGATITPKPAMPDELVRMQVVGVQEHNGPDEVRVQLWFQTAMGHEIPGGDFHTRGADGWSMRPITMASPDTLRVVHERIDAVTGEYRPPRKPAPRT